MMDEVDRAQLVEEIRKLPTREAQVAAWIALGQQLSRQIVEAAEAAGINLKEAG